MTIRKLADDFWTVTPWRCTVSGSSAVACDSLFCTWTWAISGSIPVSKVNVMEAVPAEVELDEK